jgi:nicotinamide-nucleotide amidase
MEADIITIGDEILIGQIIDTNSAWIAEELNNIGISIRQISSISDEHNHIIDTLKNSAENVKLVIITGGLGPTKDDITKNAICNFFKTKLVHNEEVLENIIKLLSPRNIKINSLNREQALVPDKAIALPNFKGTAPGLWLEKDECVFVFLPGVPFEMKSLVHEEVKPRLIEKFHTKEIIHRTLLVHGLAESMLAEKIEAWENSLPESIKLAYLPSPLQIRLRLSAHGDNRCELEKDIDKKAAELKAILPKNIFGTDKDTLAGVVGEILKERKQTVATAESCTGGNIAHFFTANSGSSDYYKGSIVAYSNEIKEKLLNIDKSVLIEHGAVSKTVVEIMAIESRKILNTDYSIATSGIAGPLGGTDEKPVGTVWIAVAGNDEVVSKIFKFGKERERNVIRFTQTALNMLLQILIG